MRPDLARLSECRSSLYRDHGQVKGVNRAWEVAKVVTVDGWEILHHQKDGWNMLKPYK